MSNNAETVQSLREELAHLKTLSSDQARTMPPSYYTSAEFLALEEEYIFRREWVCVGHTGEIPNPGDFFVTELVGESLIVTRGKDGQVRIFIQCMSASWQPTG